jgi:hypothetical protein
VVSYPLQMYRVSYRDNISLVGKSRASNWTNQGTSGDPSPRSQPLSCSSAGPPTTGLSLPTFACNACTDRNVVHLHDTVRAQHKQLEEMRKRNEKLEGQRIYFRDKALMFRQLHFNKKALSRLLMKSLLDTPPLESRQRPQADTTSCPNRATLSTAPSTGAH